ncbi:hypothetical protein D9M68_790690 [compost metagenome]
MRKLQDRQAATGAQYALHLAQPFLQVFKITYTVGTGNGIKTIIFKRQLFAIPVHQADLVFQLLLLHLGTAYSQHSFRDVYTGYLVGVDGQAGNSKITGTRSHVQDLFRLYRFNRANSFLSPAFINA